MTQLAYWEARRDILETTELGYTLKSQDKLWTCFMFDTWSQDEYQGSRLYFRADKSIVSYDVMDDELFWTSRVEAEAFRKSFWGKNPDVEVHVINWGDDRRAEAAYMNGSFLMEGKYAGSTEALVAIAAMREKWRQR